MTTQIKGYPFEVTTIVDGVRTAVLADQVKSLDWRARKAKLKTKIDMQDLNEVKAKLKPLLQMDDHLNQRSTIKASQESRSLTKKHLT